MAKKLKEEVDNIETEDKEIKEDVVGFIKELVPYVMILIVVIFLRTYIITPIRVNGSSMDPTLTGGELMILTKYDKNDLERNDIVIAHVQRVDGTYEDVIKRIIALPGESISCEKGILFVNGKRYEDKYGDGFTNDFNRIKLGDDEYFILGDNRDNSYDSSEFGAVRKSQIKGHANLVIYPFNQFGKVK